MQTLALVEATARGTMRWGDSKVVDDILLAGTTLYESIICEQPTNQMTALEVTYEYQF